MHVGGFFKDPEQSYWYAGTRRGPSYPFFRAQFGHQTQRTFWGIDDNKMVIVAVTVEISCVGNVSVLQRGEEEPASLLLTK